MPDTTVPPPEPGDDHPKRDFAKMFDLDRSTAIKNIIEEIEVQMRDIENAQGALKAIAEAAKTREFTPDEIKAMKTIAKLRLKDKKEEAQRQLKALEKIGRAAEYNVFETVGLA